MNRFVKLFFVLLIGGTLFGQTSTTFFKYTSLTGGNHIIGLPANLNATIAGVAIASGDEIGVFTSDGLCVGATTWTGVATSVVAWADNPQTPNIDGFQSDRPMYFRVYSKKAKKQYFASVEYSQPPNSFQTNGFSLLKTLTGTSVVAVENFSNPDDFRLSQNYPNPFNPSTKINFIVPISAKVSLYVYDLNGKEITRVLDGKTISAGSHSVEWNGKDRYGMNASSGLYFYKIEAIDIVAGKIAFTQVKSMLLMK
jgi:hypothetical protein